MRAAKQELRREMRGRRTALVPAEFAAWSERAAAHLLALPELARPAMVALFAGMPAHLEIDTRPIHDALAARGATLVYPRVIRPERVLRFHVVADLAALRPSSFGVPEPDPTLPEVPLTQVSVYVVPGLAFDLDGHRLGWGRGHYDHTLAAAPAALRVGYAFELQVIPDVPADAGDERVDLLVTEAGARRTTAAQVRRVH